jgi:hypothetical protein
MANVVTLIRRKSDELSPVKEALLIFPLKEGHLIFVDEVPSERGWFRQPIVPKGTAGEGRRAGVPTTEAISVDTEKRASRSGGEEFVGDTRVRREETMIRGVELETNEFTNYMEKVVGRKRAILRGNLRVEEKKRPLYLAAKRNNKGERTVRRSTIRGDAGRRRPQRKRVGDHNSLGYSRVDLVSENGCGGKVRGTERGN